MEKSSKFQVPTSREIANSKHQSNTLADWSLMFGTSLELGCWCLDVSPACLRRHLHPNYGPHMQSLLEKIEANAATRLVLTPGKLPAQDLTRFKAFLKVETHRVKLLHGSGGGGRE